MMRSAYPTPTKGHNMKLTQSVTLDRAERQALLAVHRSIRIAFPDVPGGSNMKDARVRAVKMLADGQAADLTKVELALDAVSRQATVCDAESRAGHWEALLVARKARTQGETTLVQTLSEAREIQLREAQEAHAILVKAVQTLSEPVTRHLAGPGLDRGKVIGFDDEDELEDER